MHAHLSALREANERLGQLLARAASCADTFDGPVPETTAARENHTEPSYLNSQFQSQISAIHEKLGALTEQLERIERNVFDGGSKTGVPDWAADAVRAGAIKGRFD